MSSLAFAAIRAEQIESTQLRLQRVCGQARVYDDESVFYGRFDE